MQPISRALWALGLLLALAVPYTGIEAKQARRGAQAPEQTGSVLVKDAPLRPDRSAVRPDVPTTSARTDCLSKTEGRPLPHRRPRRARSRAEHATKLYGLDSPAATMGAPTQKP